jgi:uncharacterized protein (TIGR00297 family)
MNWLLAITLNSILLIVAAIVPKKLLTNAGLIHAWVLGVTIWGTLGWKGYLVILVYFLFGSGVTRLGIDRKQAAGIAEKRDGARGPENVWGSAAVAILCAVGVGTIDRGLLPIQWQSLLLLAYTASLATKLADTTASEIGKAYGKSTFLITTLQPVERGTEGAISLEGTLAGILGGLLIGLVSYGVGLVGIQGVIIVTIAAFIATNIESLIGATLQVKIPWLSNELVNVINTAVGAIAAIAIVFIADLLHGVFQ